MPVCIVTDSTALFPNPVFTGRSQVTILPTGWKEKPNAETGRLKASDFPQSLREAEAPEFLPLSAVEFESLFQTLAARYDGVLALLHTAELSSISKHAQDAAQSLNGTVPVRVIDSHSVSLGLGLVVQAAAQAAEDGMPLAELDLYARSLLPKVYGMLCVPGLSYLLRAGYVNPSQAAVGEYLNILQVFTLDDGKLVPTQKARNPRQLVDILHEFLSEFVDLQHIALLQGAPPFEAETRALRERLAEDHRKTPISEQIINAPFASLIGPHSLGIFALEN
ncbi:MAG: DegV family protein [Anaerolineales bacterium]